jgi:hypothetical protein
MTPDRARELIQVQLQFGGGYNRNAVRLILGEIHKEHGQPAVDRLIRELDLEQRFGLAPGTDFAHTAFYRETTRRDAQRWGGVGG